MSTATISEPLASPGANGQPLSAVDYVRSLSPEDKEEILVVLLKELIEINGGEGLITFNRPGESLGYYVPPKAAQERYEKMMAELPPEVRQALEKPLPPDFDPEDSIPAEEAWRRITSHPAPSSAPARTPAGRPVCGW
jgi:hypothetical protein